MRVRHVMTTAALAGLFAACAGSEGGENGKPVYATVCEARCACEGCSGDQGGLCEAEQGALAQQAEERCQAEHTAYIDCVRLEGRCVDGHHAAEGCEVAAAALLGCLEPSEQDRCSSEGDGICDEPRGTGLCPAGTDIEDCEPPSCDHVGDGACDEPEGTGLCAEGTDVEDCAVPTCDSTDNGKCDEPEGTGLCAEGTDVEDCAVAPCASKNNGECDEPEGTGLCEEGTDVNDCKDFGTCDSLRICGSGTSGCVACANEGSCADELEACTSDFECIYFRQCAVTCADSACTDRCVADHPDGAAMYRPYDACVHCDECYYSCSAGGVFAC
ncbi:latent transforming growth factor beta-binding protein [Sorangium sp. So ce291]|uniref:latent transforming growth factor beta-binding protein n=1 Tax=Sorangium sp. So ce291 TaxID=3133294 RepID=UPI003F60D302